MTQKTDIDLEWPTFEKNDDYDRLSPDDERANIFTEFKPATEDHKIRNKRRKPKNKNKTNIRLVSESEVFGKKGGWDRKKIIVVSVLVVCVVIIVAVCVFLGVYFGVMNKSSSDGGTSAAVVDDIIPSTQSTRPSTKTTHVPVVTTKVVTSRPTPKPTLAPTTKAPTTTTTKKPTTKTTTTTTTTTTTPAPTTPPTIRYTGSDVEESQVINTTINCRKKIILTTDRLSEKKKCDLYYEMLRCVYIRLVSDRLLVPVATLGEIAETNASVIFPTWITIKPENCKENGELNIRNITSLPEKPVELCRSPDAVMYYGKHVCQIISYKDGFDMAKEEVKCRILWGVTGCVADVLGCTHDHMAEVMVHKPLIQGLQLETANQTLCNALYTEMSSSSTCEPLMYTYMSNIYNQCARVLRQGSRIAGNYACTLFETFFQCSYSQIPEVTRFETCHAEKTSLRRVAFDVALAAASVNFAVPFRNVTHCTGEASQSTYICNYPDKLVAVLDSFCYQKFKYLSEGTMCKYLSEYIYQCAPTFSKTLDLQCSDVQIRDAIVAQSDVINTNYGVDVKKQMDQDNCVVPPA